MQIAEFETDIKGKTIKIPDRYQFPRPKHVKIVISEYENFEKPKETIRSRTSSIKKGNSKLMKILFKQAETIHIDKSIDINNLTNEMYNALS